LPSFDVSAPDLKAAGPILQIFVGPSREIIAALGHDIAAAPVAVSALIDTGAAVTVITPDAAALLALRSVGETPIHTPTTIEPVRCRQFHVNVYLSSMVVIENVLAVEAPLTGQPFQCLIGRDVLSRGILVYDGLNNRFSLTF
jgi:predicted aspartyl protease